jgi:D-3-phosphoglycerate dehydrogenase / 2-oxoglutarate reductase
VPAVLLTHTPDMRANYYGERALDALRSIADVRLHAGDAPMTDAEIVEAARGCDLVIADRNTPFPALRMAQLDSVAAVLRVAVDIRNIDVAAASAAGILVTHASRTWVPAVAELAIGLMLDAARGISAANIAYKAGRPAPARMGVQLASSIAGIIGYGPLGRRVAELCRAFGMRVLVHDPYVAVDRGDVEQTDLPTLLTSADFVLPLAIATAETENLIDARALAQMKPTAFLINLSRGNLVDEAALVAALEAGRIAGAALDVGRATDQMPSPSLAARADVSATPHIGGLTMAAIEGQAMENVLQASAILAGQVPAGAVNADTAHRIERFTRSPTTRWPPR